MKKIIFALIIIIFSVGSLLAQDKNDFNNFLLFNKNFISNNFKYEKTFVNKLKGLNIKEPYTFKFKTGKSNIAIKMNKIDDENVDLKIHEKDFLDFKSFSLNFNQLWKYNISTSVAYFFKKYSNFKFLNTDFEKKGYSINISKYIKSNKFSISYEDIDLSSDKTYEDIFIQNGEKNKLTLSYQINLNKKFSIIFLYSLSKFDKNYEQENEDLFFTGFKYRFNFFNNLE